MFSFVTIQLVLKMLRVFMMPNLGKDIDEEKEVSVSFFRDQSVARFILSLRIIFM